MKTVPGSLLLSKLFLLVVSGTGLAQWNGEIVAWGRNDSGQCNVPGPNSGFVAVAGGRIHSLGLKEDGSIVAWGDNWSGQCDVPSPNSGFVAVTGGGYHSLGLKEEGTIVAWGDNTYAGQCDVPEPNEGFVAVAAGGWHSLGLREISTMVEDEGLTGGFISFPSVAPNPFPEVTTITIALPAPGLVKLDVFDLAGRHVSTLLNHTLPAGNYTATFDGSELHPGVYMIRLSSGSECATAKVVLVR